MDSGESGGIVELRTMDYMNFYTPQWGRKREKNAVRVRTCSEICIDADNHSDDLGYLSDLWEEVISNKYDYCLVELKFILEYLEDYAKEMGRKDAQGLKQLLIDGGFYSFH